MPRKVYADWISIRGFSLSNEEGTKPTDVAILNCSRCHTDMQLMLPIAINNLLAFMGPFGCIHSECEEEED